MWLEFLDQRLFLINAGSCLGWETESKSFRSCYGTKLDRVILPFQVPIYVIPLSLPQPYGWSFLLAAHERVEKIILEVRRFHKFRKETESLLHYPAHIKLTCTHPFWIRELILSFEWNQHFLQKCWPKWIFEAASNNRLCQRLLLQFQNTE